MNWYDRVKEVKELSFIDEAEEYSVDRAGIYFDPKTKKYSLITATGCSCWDGDYSEEQFPTLKKLADSLLNSEREYNPSLKGAAQLIDQAKKASRVKKKS